MEWQWIGLVGMVVLSGGLLAIAVSEFVRAGKPWTPSRGA